MIEAIRQQVTVQPGGVIQLQSADLQVGAEVEVIILVTKLVTKPVRTWQEIEGIAPNCLEGVDAQDFVNSLRDEWDEREDRLRSS